MIVDCFGDASYDPETRQDNYERSESLSILRGLVHDTYNDIYCDAGISSFAIDYNGFIVPCHFFIDTNYILGDMKTDDVFYQNKFDEITRKLHSIRKHKNNNCKDCWSKNICSLCAASILLNLHGEDPYKNCGEHKVKRKELIKKLVKENII